jgi:hypothetical protein
MVRSWGMGSSGCPQVWHVAIEEEVREVLRPQ